MKIFENNKSKINNKNNKIHHNIECIDNNYKNGKQIKVVNDLFLEVKYNNNKNKILNDKI